MTFDFSKATITREETSATSSTLWTTWNIRWFGDAIPLFKELEIKPDLYKKKIVEYLPFAFVSDDCAYLFTMIPELQKKDIDYLLNFYQQPRSDDTITNNIRNFYNACRNYKLVEAIPILEKFILNSSLQAYQRKEALEVVRDLKEDIELYKKVFDYFKDSTLRDEKEIANKANEYLLDMENKYREEAIGWRMNELISNPVKFDKSESDGFVDPYNVEFKIASFAKPLLGLNDPSGQINFLIYLTSQSRF